MEVAVGPNRRQRGAVKPLVVGRNLAVEQARREDPRGSWSDREPNTGSWNTMPRSKGSASVSARKGAARRSSLRARDEFVPSSSARTRLRPSNSALRRAVRAPADSRPPGRDGDGVRGGNRQHPHRRPRRTARSREGRRRAYPTTGAVVVFDARPSEPSRLPSG